MNQTLDNSKFQFGWNDPLVATFDQLPCCWPPLLSAITKNHKNDYHGSPFKIETCNKKFNRTKFGAIINLNMLSDILDGSPYQKLKKGLP